VLWSVLYSETLSLIDATSIEVDVFNTAVDMNSLLVSSDDKDGIDENFPDSVVVESVVCSIVDVSRFCCGSELNKCLDVDGELVNPNEVLPEKPDVDEVISDFVISEDVVVVSWSTYSDDACVDDEISLDDDISVSEELDSAWDVASVDGRSDDWPLLDISLGRIDRLVSSVVSVVESMVVWEDGIVKLESRSLVVVVSLEKDVDVCILDDIDTDDITSNVEWSDMVLEGTVVYKWLSDGSWLTVDSIVWEEDVSTSEFVCVDWVIELVDATVSSITLWVAEEDIKFSVLDIVVAIKALCFDDNSAKESVEFVTRSAESEGVTDVVMVKRKVLSSSVDNMGTAVDVVWISLVSNDGCLSTVVWIIIVWSWVVTSEADEAMLSNNIDAEVDTSSFCFIVESKEMSEVLNVVVSAFVVCSLTASVVNGIVKVSLDWSIFVWDIVWLLLISV
jgi:hypothetical protein